MALALDQPDQIEHLVALPSAANNRHHPMARDLEGRTLVHGQKWDDSDQQTSHRHQNQETVAVG